MAESGLGQVLEIPVLQSAIGVSGVLGRLV